MISCKECEKITSMDCGHHGPQVYPDYGIYGKAQLADRLDKLEAVYQAAKVVIQSFDCNNMKGRTLYGTISKAVFEQFIEAVREVDQP